ncbi:GntR family transcriptional regulator [Paenibacillus glycinis]|uniref:Substrate-binding domain-containing protein n=1 Tax=Paenibacillus glycinis TaxID=2697035 RepID=A0ABW9XXR2_9BACL|nr:GntR family transcriptional regulator [Paenibacillus glycinis]NBD27424.1 substrate-binding domain-containing protein [Paenibacillus glycinis]
MSKQQKPLYSVIMDELKKKIERGDYKPDDQIPTEYELSTLHGVSRITTRRALEELERAGDIYRIQGRGTFVRGYHRDSNEARTVESGKVVSMILPHDEESGMIRYIRGASDLLNDHGYYLSIHHSGYDVHHERTLMESIRDRGSSAIILYPFDDRSNFEILNQFCLSEYPIVTIDKYIEGMPICGVVSDNFGGVYRSVSRLIESGHRNIAFLSGVSIESASTVRERYFGYCRALKDHGRPLQDGLVKLGARTDSLAIGSEPFFHNLLAFYRASEVTAVQVENDLIAASMLKYALELGIRVPEDLSIFGFDNNPITQHLGTPISTIDQNFYEIGRKAAELILEWLEKGTKPAGRVVVPVTLVERSSTASLSPRISPRVP